MRRKIVLTGIIKYKDEYLIVKRSSSDDFLAGMWEFPGGNIEDGELLLDALKRELKEEIGYNLKNDPKIFHFYDEIKYKNNEEIHYIELDFLIEVESKDINIKLSDEHEEFTWVKKDSDLLHDFIKDKIKDL